MQEAQCVCVCGYLGVGASLLGKKQGLFYFWQEREGEMLLKTRELEGGLSHAWELHLRS